MCRLYVTTTETTSRTNRTANDVIVARLLTIMIFNTRPFSIYFFLCCRRNAVQRGQRIVGRRIHLDRGSGRRRSTPHAAVVGRQMIFRLKRKTRTARRDRTIMI
jgi:hypothetical protein